MGWDEGQASKRPYLSFDVVKGLSPLNKLLFILFSLQDLAVSDLGVTRRGESTSWVI